MFRRHVLSPVILVAALLVPLAFYGIAVAGISSDRANLSREPRKSAEINIHLPLVMKNYQPPRINVYLPLVMRNYQSPKPLRQFGIAKSRRTLMDYYSDGIVDMRFGWYVDYAAGLSALPDLGMDYVPMVRVKQWKLKPDSTWTTWCVGCPYVTPYTYTLSPDVSQIGALVSSHPGMIWAIGNEMERRDWTNNDGTPGMQDEIVPELYADAYHTVYSIIKSADPTAQVMIAGLIEATPLRLKYLQRVWDTYQQRYGQTMPVDVWNIHGFILQEKSCAAYPSECYGAEIPAGLDDTSGALYSLLDNKNLNILAQQIRAFRTWMKDHGQQNKPLYVTEYGVLMPDWASPGEFTPEQVRDSYMYPSFDFFLNHTDPTLGYPADGYRLVQRWAWYSLDDDSRFSYYDRMWDNLNGYLFYSGFEEGRPVGLTSLGLYWKQYVQSLP